MKIKNIVTILLVVIILASCAPTATILPPTETAIPTPTFTVTPPPTATATVTPTATPAPTPIGGGALKVAFYGHDVKSQFLMVGDYFTGKIDYKIPVRDFNKASRISWSPDGSFLLFVDIARLQTGDMKVNLLNTKTGQVLNLSSHPARTGTWWNNLYLIKWSPDGQRVMYANVDMAGKGHLYIASIDGTVQLLDARGSDWLPDNRTIVKILNDGTFEINSTFDILEEDKSRIPIPKLKGLKVDRLLQNYIILDAAERDKLEAIPYPEDLSDNALWRVDALLANKITLLTFSPEIKNPKIWKVDFIQDLPNKKIMVIGRCSCDSGGFFGVVIDGENLPAVITKNNLYLDEYYPIALSPDGQFVLLGTMIMDDHRNVTAFPGFSAMPWYVRFKIESIAGQEISVSDNMSQFKVEDTSISTAGWGSDPYGGNSVMNGVDFYWQP
ncbi:MAG: hypothetical protein WCC12_15635 [Anaerolineales bacterium]